MSYELDGPLPIALFIASGLILSSLFFGLYRIWQGPSTADRVVALDLVTYVAIGFSATRAIAYGDVQLLRPALVLALLAFLGTVAFARYLERRALR